MKRLAILLCLVFAAPSATATVPPLPPGGVDWEYVTYEQQEVLLLKWEHAEITGDSALDEYRVYYQIDGVQFPPKSVPSEETEYVWGALSDDSIYVFWITAVNVGGDESLPSTPLLFVRGQDYPYCTFLPIHTNPPRVPEPAVGCLLPPPL